MGFIPKSWGNFTSGGTPLTGPALIDLETRLAAYSDSLMLPLGVPQVAPYTLALTDALTIIEMNSAVPVPITIPLNSSVAFPVGTVIDVFQRGAGMVTFKAATGVTLDTPTPGSSVFATRTQNSTVRLRKRATDEWVLSGDVNTTLLWFAGMETGDYSEWTLGDGTFSWGGEFDSGPGTAVTTVDTTHAHTGSYSLKMVTDTTLGQAGTRNFRWATDAPGTDLPIHGMYTTWFYFDQVYAPVGGDWNIMQWKTKRDAVGTNDPDFCVAVLNQSSSMQLYMFDFHLGSNHGMFSPIGSLTANTWHKVEVDYRFDVNTGGIVNAYLNGKQFVGLTGITTQWPSTETGHYRTWSINNYTSANNPNASVIWADDASISQL